MTLNNEYSKIMRILGHKNSKLLSLYKEYSHLKSIFDASLSLYK